VKRLWRPQYRGAIVRLAFQTQPAYAPPNQRQPIKKGVVPFSLFCKFAELFFGLPWALAIRDPRG
jgi:hypothetical protein